MSVIGRLDGQVDEIIIKPIGSGKRLEGEERQAASEESTALTPAVDAESEAPDKERREKRPSDLPVWLL